MHNFLVVQHLKALENVLSELLDHRCAQWLIEIHQVLSHSDVLLFWLFENEEELVLAFEHFVQFGGYEFDLLHAHENGSLAQEESVLLFAEFHS